MNNYPSHSLTGLDMPPMSSVPNHIVGRNGENLLGQPVFHAPPTGTGLNPNNVQIQPHPLAPTINNMTIQTFPNFLIPIQPPQMNGQSIPTLHLGIATSFIPLPPPPRMVHQQPNNNSVGVPSSMMFTRPPGWSMVPVFSSANSVPPTGGRPRMAVPQSGNGFHGQQRPQSLPQVFLHGSAPGNYGGTGARFSVPVTQHGNGFHGQATPNQVPQVVQSNNQSTLQNQGIQNIPHRPICVTVILTSFPHVIRMNSRGTMDVVQCDSHVWRFHAQPGNGDGASALTQNGQPQQQVAVNNPGVPRGNFLAMQNYAPQQAHVANNHSGGHEGTPALVQSYGQQQPQVGALPIPSSTFFRGMDGRPNK